MNTTGLAKGLSQVGRYVLSRKEQQREAQNRFMLENLKNAMWQRRLREETERQQAQRDFLLARHKEDIGLKKLKEATDLERFNRLRDIEERRIALQEKANEIAKIKANTAKSKEDRLRADKKEKSILNDIRALDIQHDNLVGKLGSYEEKTYDPRTRETTVTSGQKYYGQQPELLKDVRNQMMEKTYELMGKTYVPPIVPKTKQPYFQQLSPELQKEYNSLINSGVDPIVAMQLLQQNYSRKGLPNISPHKATKSQKPLEEMSNEELFKELTR